MWTNLEVYFKAYILVRMGKTRAAIFIPNPEAQAHASQLKQEVRHCGCTINGSSVYSDLQSLMEAAKSRQFDVLFLNYTHLRDNERTAAREAVNRLYTLGRSVIVC